MEPPNHGNTQSPLSPRRVVRKVADLLWTPQNQCNFIIAGSYPAAVKAFERADLVLPYNDIDVYVVHQHKDAEEEETFLESVQREEVVIQGQQVEVNIMTLGWWQLDLKRLIDRFDINAITTGFEVKPTMFVDQPWTAQWYERPSFQTFLQTRILEIVDLVDMEYPASAFVRLMRKAQQLKPMGISYRLPHEELLLTTLHNRCIGEATMEKLVNLAAPSQREVFKRFALEPLYWEKKQISLFCFKRRDGHGPDQTEANFLIDPYTDPRLFHFKRRDGPDHTEADFHLDPYTDLL